jgi:hypothetical protein
LTTYDTNRKTAIIAGTLLIIATFASILSNLFLKSVHSSNYLGEISANGNLVTEGALLMVIAAVTSASIAISLYPVLKKYSEGLALGAVGFRLIEGVFYIVGILGLVLLLTLSQEFVQAGTPDASVYQILGTLLLAGREWVGFGIAPTVFGLGSLMYYSIFYQTELIPRWLSGWGLAGAVLCMVASVSVMSGLISPLSTIHIVLNLPIALQEMVMAVWLIVKGFNPSAIASLSPRTGINEVK